jgi:hypothetical protein
VGYSSFDGGPGLVSPAYSASSNVFERPTQSAKCFPCHPYENPAHNCFVSHAQKNKGLKVLCFPYLRKKTTRIRPADNQELA